MKVLFIAEFFPSDTKLTFTGGVESYNYYLVNELAKSNHVTVICRSNPHSQKELKIKNVTIFRTGFATNRIDTGFLTIPKRLGFILKLIQIGLQQDFDIVQGNNFVTYMPAFLIGLLKRKPTVAWYPDVFIDKWKHLTGQTSGIIGELVEKISLKIPWTHIIALSNQTKQKIVSQGVHEDKITTILAGVDTRFIDSVKVRKEKIFTMCCISRLVSYKRVDLLVNAAGHLKDKGYAFKLVIIGDGSEKDNLKTLIKQLDLTRQVTIESHLSRHDLIKKLKSSHLLVHPSEQEGFGLVVIEAVASKVPYVVSDLEVLKEITHNGKGGLLFKTGDGKDLAKKIERFLIDMNLTQRLVQQGRQLLTEYKWSKISHQFEQIYQDISTKKPKIIMLADAWFPYIGGGQVHTWELAKRLADKGLQLTIYTRNLGEYDQSYKNIKIVKVGHFKEFSNIFGRVEYLLLSLWYCLTHRYDLLHIFAFSPGLIAPIIKLFKKQPIIYSVLGDGIKIAGLPVGENFLQDLVFYKIPYDLEITVSKNIIKKPVAAKKLVFISNGVNIDQFKPAQKNRQSVKNILGIGRLYYDKGMDLLIEAFKSIKNPPLLTIVGDGPEEKNLKQQAKGLKNITFLKSQLNGDYIKVLKNADLMVIPSRTEGLPLRLLDAWSSKLPVVATHAGDLARYITNDKNGFLVYDNADSIKEGILYALNSHNLLQVAENGYQTVQKYSWDSIAEKTYKEYKKLLDSNS